MASPPPVLQHVRRPEPYFLLAILSWAIYAVAWSIISMLRITAFRSSVYDLGVFAQLGWRVYGTHLSPEQVLVTFFNAGGSLFLFPVVVGGYDLIVTVQSVALGFGAVLLFLISRRHQFSPRTSLLFSVVYLLYFPLAGVNFTDVHYEAFLIPLFLAGYLLLLEARFVWSMVAFLLAGSLKYPLATFPFLFGILIAAPLLCQVLLGYQRLAHPGVGGVFKIRSHLRRVLYKVSEYQPKRVVAPIPAWYGYGLPIVAGAILLGGFLTNQLYYPGTDAIANAHAGSLGLFSNLGLKWFSLLVLFAPLAFTPLLSPRWMVLCGPFVGLVFFANYIGYSFPYIVTDWYTCLIIPFLMLGMIDGIDKLRGGSTWMDFLIRRWSSPGGGPRSSGSTSPAPSSAWPRLGLLSMPGSRPWRRQVPSANRPAAMVLVLVLASAAFFTPYGPFNSETQASFNFPSLLSENTTLYDHFLKLASLIPRSDPAVILQDNMPELLPRPLMPGSLSPLVAGPFGQVAYNLTWPNPNGSWTPINPDYVIGNPNPLVNNFFTAPGPFPFNVSMQQILNRLYATYDYGILGEADGMLVLEHHYTGPLAYYVPYAETLPAYDFYSRNGTFNASDCAAPCLANGNVTHDQDSWYGPYLYLSPGSYDVTFEVGLVGWTESDHTTLDISSGFGTNVLASTTISGPSATPESLRENVTLRAFVDNGATQVEFRGLSSSYNGTLLLYAVHVNEIAPPPTIFTVGYTSEDQATYALLNLTPPGATVLSEDSLAGFFQDRTQVSAQNYSPLQPPTYELYDPNIPSNCAPGTVAVCSIINASYSSGAFGVVDQNDGVTLLEHDVSVLQSFVPLEFNESPLNLSATKGVGQLYSSYQNGTLIVQNQTNDGYSWYGPYASLPPGDYTAIFDLTASNAGASNHMMLDITSDFGRILLGSQLLTGSQLASSGQPVPIEVPFELDFFSSTIEFRGLETVWSGAIELHLVEIQESGPP